MKYRTIWKINATLAGLMVVFAMSALSLERYAGALWFCALALANAAAADWNWRRRKDDESEVDERSPLEALNPVVIGTGGPFNMPLYDFSKSKGCPDCGSNAWNPGPTGGMARNIRCSGCGSKFCFAPPFTPDRINNSDQLYNLNEKLKLEEL